VRVDVKRYDWPSAGMTHGRIEVGSREGRRLSLSHGRDQVTATLAKGSVGRYAVGLHRGSSRWSDGPWVSSHSPLHRLQFGWRTRDGARLEGDGRPKRGPWAHLQMKVLGEFRPGPKRCAWCFHSYEEHLERGLFALNPRTKNCHRCHCGSYQR
jgi:hypothetical protein